MSNLPPIQPDEGDSEDWLVTYADAITLLMAFFVVMFSISDPNIEKFEAVTRGIKESLYHEKPATPLGTLSSKVSNAVASFDGGDQANAAATPQGYDFEFRSGAMFRQGSSDLLQDAEPLLDRV